MGKKKGVRVRHLVVLLIKDDFAKPEDCLKDPSTLTLIKTSSKLPQTATFFFQAKQAKPPAWLDFMQEGLAVPVSLPENENVAAVLFIKEQQSKRLFAFTFAQGRNLLRPDCFERDFGLRVVLNTVDPSQLRSIDARTFEELTVHTRRQASRGSSIETFGVNITQDIVRSFTGKPKDAGFANRIIGSDSLAFSAKIEVSQLDTKCKDLFGAYRSKSYQTHFPWFDYLRAERDPSIVDRLNTRLLDKLKSGHLDNMHLAPPEVIDWEHAEGLSFSTQQSPEPMSDVLVEDYINTLKQPVQVSVLELKRHQLQIHYSNASAPTSKWSIYDSLVFEIEESSDLFILSGGDWFRVAKKFADKTKEKVKSIKPSSLALPAAASSEKEEVFNKNTAKTMNFILMDRKNAFVEGGNQPIEICDLFTPNRQFLHIKRKTKSATLSHLFSQGVVAAESFLADANLRNHARNVIAQSQPRLRSLIPTDRPDPKDFEVVYGIIAKNTQRWPLSLPFFSQLNLSHAHDRLHRMGYKVSLLRIDEV